MDGFTYNCGLLRLFDGFSDRPDSRVSAFVYQHDDPELQRLRTRFNLDAIAQDGDDWSKALNLLRWVCDHLCHFDIAKSLPLNARDLLDYAFGKGEAYGINCLMLATVLTEACLSVGLKARRVGIFPLNPFDLDNHVVTIVWCKALGKWAMLDPSFRAFLSDETGQVLSPWEARERFCRREAVVCNDELSYNGKPHKPEEYLAYLAKDLMYLRSAVCGRSGRTTDPPQRWVTLAPEGLDVLKRESYNARWRSGGESGDWDRATLQRSVDQRRAQLGEQHLYTHSVASFAQPPA